MLFLEKTLKIGSNTCSKRLFTEKGLLDSHPGTVFYGAVSSEAASFL